MQIRWLLIMCGAWAIASNAEDRFSFEKTPGKLPKDVVPRHYQLELKPDVEAATVTGRETVDIEVLKPTSRIVMNAAELAVSSAKMSGGGDLKISLDATNQLAILEAGKTLAPGKYRLIVEFSGKITETPAGMFAMKYVAPSGPKKVVATQFEATDARRVFPCFDEPVFRATFELTAEIPKDQKAVSNMPVEEIKPGAKGWKKVRFGRTLPMPDYLVALVVGELEEIHGRAGKVDTSIWFTEGKKEQARYALENSKRLLAYYEKYFGVSYPLPKLDHIAMPGGFGGAMENWGAITYDESNILFDSRRSSQDAKERSFAIMAHEMAHQWFGNLVTMAWWDNLWLNEGFASWMGTKATDILNPDWNHWVRQDVAKAGLMAFDARKSTHPIQRAIANESEIGDAFDGITYSKGMFFIRMLEDYLGEQKFQEGLQRYMKRHALGNTTTADLWAAMAEVSHKPVGDFAAGWTEQPGLPVIIASARCVDGKQEILLRQERYTLLDPGAAPLRWTAPVSAIAVGGNEAPFQAVVEKAPVTFKLGGCDDAIKLNAGSRGYYRVACDGPMFDRLRGAWSKLTEIDRVSFLSDAWAMLESGKLPVNVYLDLLPKVADETSLAVWEQTLGALETIDGILERQPQQADFRRRVLALLRPALAKLGMSPRNGESTALGLLRARLLGVTGGMGDREVVAEARRRFEMFRKDSTALTGDLRATFLNIVGRHAMPTDYAELRRLAKAATDEEDREILLGALSLAEDENIARETLELSLAKDFPPVESARLVSQVSGSGRHPQLAWDFMKQHHREIMQMVAGPFQNMYTGSTVSGFDDDARAAEFLEFIKTHFPPDAIAKAEEAADGIRYRAQLKREIQPAVDKWSHEGDLR